MPAKSTLTAEQFIMDATSPEDLFGDFSTGRELQEAAERWRTLSRKVHPDVSDDPDRANEVMGRLNVLYEATKRAIRAGTYGKASTVVDPVLIQSRRNAYKVTDLLVRGSACNVYAGTISGKSDAPVLLKVARDRKDNPLLANEAEKLKRLLTNSDTYDDLSPYLPEYIETFGYRPSVGAKKPRQTIAFTRTPNLFTLDQVRDRYPRGVNPKDAAWMMRRLLYALELVHRNGLVHGAVLPEHVLIEPLEHGLVLIDWKYSVEIGQQMTRSAFTAAGVYPEEVSLRDAVTPATDIFMAVGCMAYVMGGNLDGGMPTRTSRQIRAFINGCRQVRALRRPQNAGDLRAEWTELIERMWGPRKFRPFSMEPTNKESP